MTRPRNNTIIEKYIDHYKTSIASQNTRRSSLNYFFGDKYFNYIGHIFDISKAIIDDYFNYLVDCPVSRTTKVNKWNIFMSFLKRTVYIYDEFTLILPPKNFYNFNGDHAKPINSNKNVIADPEEIEKILLYFKEVNFKYYILFRLFVETGMRKGELINATLSEVNLEDRYINTFKGKTGEKFYFFTEDFQKQFRMYLYERKKFSIDIDYLFLNNRYEQYGVRSFNKYLEKVRAKLGIKKRITCHTFRRTINTLRKKMGTSLEDRERLLGHKTGNVNVDGYTILDIQEHQKIYDQNFPYLEIQL